MHGGSILELVSRAGFHFLKWAGSIFCGQKDRRDLGCRGFAVRKKETEGERGMDLFYRTTTGMVVMAKILPH